ncbi:MAG: cph2 1 [Paenibacillus sp.]|nr:cph2 1 [Paenibacillus sp.]
MVQRILNAFRIKKLTNRLFALVILLIFLSGCLHTVSYIFIDKTQRIEDLQTDLHYSLANQKMLVESWARERAKEIRYLGDLPVTKKLAYADMLQTFQNFRTYSAELESIVFVNKEGFAVIDTLSEKGILQSSLSLKDRDYFIAAEQGNEFMYDVVVSRTSGQPVIIFSSPVRSELGQFQGVIFGSVNLSKVNAMLGESIKGESGQLILTNREGIVLSCITKASGKEHGETNVLATKLNSEITGYMLSGQVPSHAYTNNQGNEVFGSYIPLLDGRYYLIHEIGKRELLQPHYQMIVVMLLISLLIFVVGVLLTVPVSGHVLRPFVLLEKAMHRLKEGNYETIMDPGSLKSGNAELQRLVARFNEMSATIYEHQKTMQQLSTTDALTGIANRRGFEEYLEREWLRARREQTPLALALLDVDFFKPYNDIYGHLAGDDCLRKVSQAILHALKRPGDLAARYGGEEFAVILPDTNLSDAAFVAENIRAELKKMHIVHAGNENEYVVTVSIGVASVVPSRNADWPELIDRADKALYEAKSGGKNKVVRSNRV